MKTTTRCLGSMAVLCVVLVLAACSGGGGGGGGGGGNPPPPVMRYSVGGTVAGLTTGATVVLRINNGGDTAITGNGTFTFPALVAAGGTFNVTIASQPASPAPPCDVMDASGVVNGNVTTVTVTCFAAETIFFQRMAGGTQIDLYSIGEEGTGLVVIADTTDNEYIRGVTSDGKVLFQRAGSLFVVNPDGNGEQLLMAGGDAASLSSKFFSPSGRVLATSNSDLYSVNIDGTGLSGFGSTAGTELFSGFAPSGGAIYSRTDKTLSDNISILRANADGTGEIPISPANTTEIESVKKITPSGRVVFSRATSLTAQTDLYSVNEDGTGFVTLSADPVLYEYVSAAIPNERVIYCRRTTLSSAGPPADCNGSPLYSVRSDGTGAATLSLDPAYYLGATLNGEVIFYREVIDPVAAIVQTDIFVINADGTGLHGLGNTPANEIFFGVIPDGRILFGRSTGPNGEYDLFLINPDGSDEIQLTNTPDEIEVAICTQPGGCVAPGGRIIFIRYPNLLGISNDLYSVRTDGSGEMALTHSLDQKYPARVTANGRLIYMLTAASGQRDIYSIKADGTDLKTLAGTADSEDPIIFSW